MTTRRTNLNVFLDHILCSNESRPAKELIQEVIDRGEIEFLPHQQEYLERYFQVVFKREELS
jgi:hypothetical protein